MTTTTTRSGIRLLNRDEMLLLTYWRERALSTMPYMAAILYGLRPVSAPGLGTMAVDKHMRLYVDFGHAKAEGEVWSSEGLLHECGHVFGQHAERAVGKGVSDSPQDRRDFNLGADMSINDDLVAAGCGMTPEDPMPKHIGEPDHKTAEHYYDVIRQARQRQDPGSSCSTCGRPKNQQGSQQGQNGPGQSVRGGQQPGPEHELSQSGPQCPDCGGQVQFAGCGSGAGGMEGAFELDSDDDAGGTAPAMDDVERELMVLAAAQDVIDAAKSRGTVPGGLLEQAQMVVQPSKVPWRKLLAGAIRRSVRAGIGSDKRTYNKVHKRRTHIRVNGRKVVYPGRYTPRPTIAVVRDTSASMSARELEIATSEIVAIATRLKVKGADLRVLDVDAAVHTVKGYAGAAMLGEVAGRGGTDMCVGIEAAVALQPRPSAVVVISDGGTPWPTERTEVPLVVVLVGPYAQVGEDSVPDWATLVIVDDTGASEA